MLEKYNKKRNFKKTLEPKGEVGRKKSGHQYLIQKHAARRLHFDFRLEHNGVLKSWAVPKGPSVDPKVKRLAVEVEDHPIAYGDFEGTIPQGEYGGGTVMLWDQGEWEPLTDVNAGLKKGHLLFNLKGSRLKGKWNLVRSHQKDEKENKPVWFLIKAKYDEGESKVNQNIEPVEKELTSVTTGRTLDQIGSENLRTWGSKRKNKTSPLFRKPQLATLVSEVPKGKEWIHEIKFDGYRMQALINRASSSVKIISRNENDWTDKFLSLIDPLLKLKCESASLDGEVVVLDNKGISDFQLLQNSFESQKKTSYVFYIFDILELNGKDLTSLPLNKRKEILGKLLETVLKEKSLRFSDHIELAKKDLLNHACRLGLEGIVSKRVDGTYSSGRTDSWVKAKCEKRQEFIIIGYSSPKGLRAGLGALLLAIHDKNKNLIYAGRVGTGFDVKLLNSLKTKLSKIQVSKSPLETMPKNMTTRDVTWVKPKYLCEVKFSQWTKDESLRHPVFLGLREDKEAINIKKEIPIKNKILIRKAKLLEASDFQVEGVTITKPSKVMFSPDITKINLARYYQSVSDLMLPYLDDRPISIVRCPDGHDKMCFFQKHPTHEKRFISVKNKEDLLTYSQQGTLEFHVWGAKFSDIERPDIIVFDLDPDSGLEWKKVVDAAIYLKDVLKKMGLTSFVKTTGGKGLHVVAPFQPDQEWDEVKNFTKKIAEGMSKLQPDRYLSTMSKKKRFKKIFIDYLRNGRGSTFVAPYSTRTKAGATVSMPIFWKDLDNGIRSDSFTVRNVNGHLSKRKTDPWKDFFSLKQKLPQIR
jgi:bifunctional non-homologous end joining protein LigD